jgi:hypothetical protein
MTAATSAHAAALAEREQRLEAERAAQLATLEAEHRQALAGLKSASVRQIQHAKVEKDQLALALTRVRRDLEQATRTGEALRRERDAAGAAARDLWQTLRQSLGDAASLALAFGIELGAVPKCSDVATATQALKAALRERALCRELEIESVAQSLLVEVRPSLALEGDAVAQWIVAFVTEYLEQALEVTLSAESTSHGQDWLKLRLGRAAPATSSESAPS